MPNTSPTLGVNQDEWAQAIDKGKEAAASVGAMASHAGSAVGAMASQAACDTTKKIDDLTASAGAGIQGFGDRISNYAPHTGVLGTASQAVAQTVKDGGEYLEDAKMTGVIDDVTQLIRRNPLPAIFIAIGLGWFVARRLRT